MDFLKNQIDDLNLIVTVNIKREDVQPNVVIKLKEIRRTYPFPGFRPGATPMSLVQKRFGPAVFLDKLNEYANKQIEEYIKRENIDVLFHPIIAEEYEPLDAKDIETAEDFNFPFHFGLKPEFDETELYKTKFTKYNVTFGNEIVDKVIDGYKQSLGDFESVDTVNVESMVKVSLEQTDKDKNVIEDGINIEKVSILIRTLSEENKNLFIGKNLNYELNADIKKIYPNDSEIASILSKPKEEIEKEEELFFNIKIIDIKDFVLCGINQKMFDYCYGKDVCITEEDFMTRLRADIATNYENESKKMLSEDIKIELQHQLNTLVPLPENFLRKYIEINKENEQEDSESELTDEIFEANLNYLRWNLLREQVFTKNNITVTEEEKLEFAKIVVTNYMMEQYGYTLPQEQIIDYAQALLKDKKQVFEIEIKLQNEKLIDFFISHVKLEEKDVTFEELKDIYQEKEKEEEVVVTAKSEGIDTKEAELAAKLFVETAKNTELIESAIENAVTIEEKIDAAEIVEEPAKTVKEKVKKNMVEEEKTIEPEDAQSTENKPKPKTKKVNKDSIPPAL